MSTNKIKLEAPGSVNKCHMVHTDMAGGDFADLSLDSAVRGYHIYKYICMESASGVPCLDDNSDKSRGVYDNICSVS